MESAVGRNEQAALFPIDTRLCLRFGIFDVLLPHQRVAAPVQHHHVRAGAVTVGFLISAHLEFRNVALHRVFGQLQLDARIPLAALFDLGESDHSGIWDETAVPRVAPTRDFAGFERRLLVMEILLPGAFCDYGIPGFQPIRYLYMNHHFYSLK
jgi:hypothetical protein